MILGTIFPNCCNWIVALNQLEISLRMELKDGSCTLDTLFFMRVLEIYLNRDIPLMINKLIDFVQKKVIRCENQVHGS